MKAFYDFLPQYCPNCGKRTAFYTGRMTPTLRAVLDDFHSNDVWMICDCGLQFKKLSADVSAMLSLIRGVTGEDV